MIIFLSTPARQIALAVLIIFGCCIPDISMAATASVDHIQITVYYTEAVAAAVPFFSWWSLPLMLIGVVWVMKREGIVKMDTV